MVNITEERIRVIGRDGITLQPILGYRDDAAGDKLFFIFPPHPNLGGDIDNNIVEALFHGIIAGTGIAVKIVYRGTDTGEVQGTNAFSYWEMLEAQQAYDVIVQDTIACIEQVRSAFTTSADLYFIPYSFGNYIALMAANQYEQVALVGISPPLAAYDFSDLFKTVTNAHFIISQQDLFCDPVMMKHYAAAYCFSYTTIDADDHFYRGSEALVTEHTMQRIGLQWKK